MESLIIEKTKTTPQINFNANNGKLEISGESYPEDSLLTYRPIINWIEEFLNSSKKQLSFNFKLSYFNTSSSKCLLNILEMLDKASSNGWDIEINWYYQKDDEDMLETGEEFAEDISINFNFISI